MSLNAKTTAVLERTANSDKKKCNSNSICNANYYWMMRIYYLTCGNNSSFYKLFRIESGCLVTR